MPILPLSGAASSKGAMIPFARTILTSDGGVYLTNIPQNCQDLRIVVSSRSTTIGNDNLIMYIKESVYGYSTTDYSTTYMSSDGSSATSTRNTNVNRVTMPTTWASYMPYNFATTIIDILNYSSTSSFKSIFHRGATDNAGSGVVQLGASLWRKNDAITELGFYMSNGAPFLQAGSSVTLYGVRSINQ